MDETRIFTVAEANELVPELSVGFERIVRLRRLIGEHIEKLDEGGADLDLQRPLERQSVPEALEPELMRLVQMIKEIGNTISRFNDQGCVVKDIDLGLVDFYSIIDGRPVWLCWQFGERKVAHYHAIDEGFSARATLTGGKHPGVLYN